MTTPVVQQSRIITGLPQSPEGVPEELFGSFLQVYQAIENLRQAMSQFAGVDSFPTDYWPQLTIDDTFFDGDLNRIIGTANEAINFGQAVSPILSGGTLQFRLANATTNARWCCGFSITPSTVPIGGRIEIMTRGMMLGISGMNTGSRYWLSTTPGSIQNAPAVAAGNIEQVVGWAAAGNRLICNIDSSFVQH